MNAFAIVGDVSAALACAGCDWPSVVADPVDGAELDALHGRCEDCLPAAEVVCECGFDTTVGELQKHDGVCRHCAEQAALDDLCPCCGNHICYQE